MTIKLSEVFTQLSYGELSQLSIGGQDAGVINSHNYEKIIPHLNMALTALYNRFPLKENRLTLLVRTGRVTYPLTKAFAISNLASTETDRFIDDLTIPYTEDILKIERVYNSDGYEFGLNDHNSSNSLFTPSNAVLRIPTSVESTLLTASLEVVYRASHPMISTGDGAFNPNSISLELPHTHLEPLLLYVASRFHAPTGMVNEFNMSNNYAAKYEAACQLIEQQNLKVDQQAQFNRFQENGWV